MIKYRGTLEEVRLGDVVDVPYFFFWKRRGIVLYVPGVSPLNPELERDGLQWVGIKFEDGQTTATVADPDTEILVKAVNLIERGEITE